MLLEGKYAKPVAHWAEVHRHALTEKIHAPTLVIEAPSGYLLTDSLEAILEESGRTVIWLRLESEDDDPAACLFALAEAIQRLDARVGRETLAQMKRLPGPLQGWQALFRLLGDECGAYIHQEAVLVIEHMHHLSASTQARPLLCQTFLPHLPDNFQVILTMQERSPLNLARQPVAHLRMKDLQLDAMALEDLLQQSGVRLSAGCRRHAIALAQGRAVGLAGLCGAAQILGLPFVERLMERSRSQGESFQQIARNCLGAFDRDDLTAVNLLVHLGYIHPTILKSIRGVDRLPSGPWAQALSHSWSRPYHLWREPLKTAIRATSGYQPEILCSVAGYLCQNTSALDGVWLYFKLGCMQQAAQHLAKHASQILQAGFWETFQRWLELLPASVLRGQPWLLHAGGELKSNAGDLHGAMQMFRQANTQFMRINDAAGACTSLLALSIAADWLGETGKAWAAADEARSMSEAAGMPWQQGWAEFQLACLAAREGNLNPASEHFRRASELATQTDEPLMLDCIGSMVSLLEEQRQIQERKARHQQAMLESERAESEQAARLIAALSQPPGRVEHLTSAHGWLTVPLMFKMPRPNASWKVRAPERAAQPWKRWLRWLQPRKQRAQILDEVYAPNGNQSINADHIAEFVEVIDAGQRAADSPTPETSNNRKLTVYFFGGFRLETNDEPVTKLPTGRGGMILKYLMYYHQRNLPRDQLMELLWPEAEPDMARNRLNVALSGLRRELRRFTRNEVIVFDDGKYGLDSSWTVWVDVEEFERSLEAARRLESAGKIEQAIQHLEVAANLYQGDFLAEDPYEEWTISIRERLRLAYLDALYLLGRRYFELGQYGACAALCQSILERDRCREDVHCLLMRCYAGQEQIPLALRQYQVCVEALRGELDVSPAASTMALYQRLRQRRSD